MLMFDGVDIKYQREGARATHVTERTNSAQHAEGTFLGYALRESHLIVSTEAQLGLAKSMFVRERSTRDIEAGDLNQYRHPPRLSRLPYVHEPNKV